uniref:NADH-ubiquinone oxidoreductase chain 6 n=1 Tax=Trichocera bimacula TaxID=174634 RepID=G8J8I7_9DIPT|nr:NADH dehydrogenase subunit 6 [Trichocera bimacula]AET13105.1 NADH dehydrogenase subunit 6 [Trichocera bimacula]
MFNFIISSCSVIFSFIFMQMKHPLAMGLMLLSQTFLICLITGIFSKTFWFSYVLFLVFLGGMLVLFIYVTSLASNEMFSFSMKMLTISLTLLLSIFFLALMMDKTIISSLMMNSEMLQLTNLNNLLNEDTLNLNKLYNYPTNLITLLLINYLFLTLIAVVKITNIFQGPLRPSSN